VTWAHDSEIAAVERGDLGLSEALADGDHRGVHKAEVELLVGGSALPDEGDVVGLEDLVARDDRRALAAGLGDEETIEGI